MIKTRQRGSTYVNYSFRVYARPRGLRNDRRLDWGLLILLAEKTVRIPLRYYGSAIGLMSGGLGLVGLAQVLRLLLVIVGKG